MGSEEEEEEPTEIISMAQVDARKGFEEKPETYRDTCSPYLVSRVLPELSMGRCKCVKGVSQSKARGSLSPLEARTVEGEENAVHLFDCIERGEAPCWIAERVETPFEGALCISAAKSSPCVALLCLRGNTWLTRIGAHGKRKPWIWKAQGCNLTWSLTIVI